RCPGRTRTRCARPTGASCGLSAGAEFLDAFLTLWPARMQVHRASDIVVLPDGVASTAGAACADVAPCRGARRGFRLRGFQPEAERQAWEPAANATTNPPMGADLLVCSGSERLEPYAAILAADGHHVVTVSDGEEALERLARGGCDLVVLETE